MVACECKTEKPMMMSKTMKILKKKKQYFSTSSSSPLDKGFKYLKVHFLTSNITFGNKVPKFSYM